MEDKRAVVPFGAWASPISTEMVLQQGVRLFQPRIDADATYWLETRPREDGRTVLVVESADGERRDVNPPGSSVRSRVHEYGGGAFLARSGHVWFVENRDQAIYRVVGEGKATRLTAEPADRHADLDRDDTRGRLVCVCETHRDGGPPDNFIASIDDDGTKRRIAEGHDFYSSPRVSPDGRRMAWITWDHPRLPWDGSQLWVADLDDSGTPLAPTAVAGGDEESVTIPAWGPDGRLFFVSDRRDWWNLYAWDGDGVVEVARMDAEAGLPHWVFGQSTYGFVDEHTMVFAASSEGRWTLYRTDLRNGVPESVAFPYDAIEHVAAGSGRACVLAGGARNAPAVYSWSADGTRRLVGSSDAEAPRDWLSVPEAIAFPTGREEVAHGLFYPPRNPDFEGRAEELPPIIVKCHGGPTGATSTAQDLRLHFWTSRGFAVLDLDYRGSTGYGRAYRRSLYGRWGVADVEDCVAAVRYLARAGRIDGDRALISGGSAGGYTVLCALTFTDAFRAGASYYGIGDLESLFATTHKFEARYDYWLLGAGPDAADLYRERSPLHHADRLDCPVIFFQGGQDRVVPPEQSQVMARALRAKGLPVAYLEFPEEAHGFRQASTIQRALEAELSFYCRLLGLPLPDVPPLQIDNLPDVPG